MAIHTSADDNPPILSGKAAHGGVVLLWKVAIDDYVSLLHNIKSDHIVGIQCEFPGHILLFILGVYLPSARILKNIVSISIIFGHCMIFHLLMAKSFSWVILVAI